MSKRIEQNKKDWEIGFSDGLANTRKNRASVVCGLSYQSGYIEGKAQRSGTCK